MDTKQCDLPFGQIHRQDMYPSEFRRRKTHQQQLVFVRYRTIPRDSSLTGALSMNFAAVDKTCPASVMRSLASIDSIFTSTPTSPA